MTKYIRIKADTNDADYIEKTNVLKDEDESLVRRWAEALKDGSNRAEWGHNWPTNEFREESVHDLYEGVFTKDELYRVDRYVPYGEYGVHTVEEVEIFEKLNEERLF